MALEDLELLDLL